MDDNYKEAGFDEPISERERRRQQLELEFSFDGYYAIRKELYADLKDPAMTIRDGSIHFNNACINALENVIQIETFFNDGLKRFALFIRHDKGFAEACHADARNVRVLRGHLLDHREDTLHHG